LAAEIRVTAVGAHSIVACLASKSQPEAGAAPQAGDERSGCLAAQVAPGGQRGDRVGGGVLAVRDRDQGAVAFLVDLRLPDGEQSAGGLVVDVGPG
jgi:hypothetical protein